MDTATSTKSKPTLAKGLHVPPYITLTRNQQEAIATQPELIAGVIKIGETCMKFTGVALATIYRPHLGFADFSIVQLRLKDGTVEQVEEISDPYAAMEAQARMEIKQAELLEKMRKGYPAEYRQV